MNKLTKKIVSVFTACALAVCGLSVAGTPAKAATVESTLVPALITDLATLPTPASTAITLPGAAGNKSATPDSLAKIVQISVEQRGVLNLGITASGLADSVEANLYSDAACTLKVGYSMYITTSSLTAQDMYTITTPGTYYLKLSWRYNFGLPETGSVIGVAAYAYTGEELTLNDSFQAVYTGDSNIINYHKLVLPSDSMVTLYGNSCSTYDNSANSISINLCDKDKITLDEPYLSSYDNYFSYYALKKGTYYIATNEDSPYQLKATVVKIKDQSGKSKGKAKLINKKKTVKGLVALSEGTSKVDWFKVKLAKNGKMKFKYTAKCNGSSSLKLEVIAANPNYTLYNNVLYMQTGTNGFTTKKIRKGTYYIKISKTYGEYSGSYSLKRLK